MATLAWRSVRAAKRPSGTLRRQNPLAMDRASPVRYACPLNPFCGRRLAALVGRYSEAMGVAVIISDKELGLSVVAIRYLRN